MMLKKDKKIEKLYYTIGEVSELFEVNASLIRFWEKEFDILKPKKNKKGNRLFTPQDIDHLRIIYHLVKERGYTLQGAREKLKNNKEEVINKVAVVDSLNRIKEFLLDLKEQMQ
ncbi:MAG: MerR family transcriptional regulator [Bacteroidales bacterium]|nr:MerR family transcriptional regulator [Bacteroidales bacterium]HNW72428.1 MerR family transcriptional regulator [Bacteroidales bacterium]HPS49447.1 MerR family transcriptional regulator [Bacteroidales bacterium]